MKKFPSKPKYPAITSAIQQALLISATTNNQATSSSSKTPEPAFAKASKQANLPNFDTLPDSGFVRLPSLQLLFACSRATIWRWVNAGKLPSPKKLSPRVTVWNVGELRLVLSAYMTEEAA